MKHLISLAALASLLPLGLGTAEAEEKVSLKVRVDSLRNSKGAVQFSLYNKKGSIPDEKFKKYYRQRVILIVKNSSWVTFKDLPPGRYAVSVHHDENRNGKINKGLILPTEGVGFSNYKSVGLTNRPNFGKASFDVQAPTEKSIKMIYF